MQFIAVKQHDYECREDTLHFLQWTGNEKELVYLWKLIHDAIDAEVPADQRYSEFYCEIVFISEAAVDEMMKLDYGMDRRTFEKHIGAFKLPDGYGVVDDPDEAHYFLNRWYHGCGFKPSFTTPT